MLSHVMLQYALEYSSMLHIAGFLGMLDVIDNHALDALFAAGGMRQIVAQLDGEHFRDMFVLSNGTNQITFPETENILLVVGEDLVLLPKGSYDALVR